MFKETIKYCSTNLAKSSNFIHWNIILCKMATLDGIRVHSSVISVISTYMCRIKLFILLLNNNKNANRLSCLNVVFQYCIDPYISIRVYINTWKANFYLTFSE